MYLTSDAKSGLPWSVRLGPRRANDKTGRSAMYGVPGGLGSHRSFLWGQEFRERNSGENGI